MINKAISVLIYVVLFINCISIMSCSNDSRVIEASSIYNYLVPEYSAVQLNITSDTLHFQVDERTYNSISSVNLFSNEGSSYISFYDKRSGSINIYNLSTQILVKRLSLQQSFSDQKLYKASVHCANFDSIFVTNRSSLYLLDTAGIIKDSIRFLDDPPFAWAYFESAAPLVIGDNKVYAAVRPFVDEKSLKAIREWRVLYELDMTTKDAKLLYRFPELYRSQLYGSNLLDFSYCYNDDRNFVFSFSADSNIYEYGLNDFHKSYFGKSYFQSTPIFPLTKAQLEADEGFKQYLLRDSYGSIYYDSFKKRYLRIARGKLSESDYESKKFMRRQSIVLFDDNFKIIGESVMDGGVRLNSIFFTKDGKIYARVKADDEYALHFVRLDYSEIELETNIVKK